MAAIKATPTTGPTTTPAIQALLELPDVSVVVGNPLACAVLVAVAAVDGVVDKVSDEVVVDKTVRDEDAAEVVIVDESEVAIS